MLVKICSNLGEVGGCLLVRTPLYACIGLPRHLLGFGVKYSKPIKYKKLWVTVREKQYCEEINISHCRSLQIKYEGVIGNESI